jgi:hypothetical protein
MLRKIAQMLTLLSLILSYYLMFSGITPEGIFIYGEGGDGVSPITPVGGLPVFLAGFFLFAVNLYILKTTHEFTHWRDISLRKKLIPMLLIILSNIALCIAVFYLFIFLFFYYTKIEI